MGGVAVDREQKKSFTRQALELFYEEVGSCKLEYVEVIMLKNRGVIYAAVRRNPEDLCAAIVAWVEKQWYRPGKEEGISKSCRRSDKGARESVFLKICSEFEGPAAVGCPRSVLDKLTLLSDWSKSGMSVDYALDWRRRCYKNLGITRGSY